MKTQRKNKGKKQQKRTTKVDENKNQQTANPPNEQLSNASQPTNEAHTGEKNREQQTNNIPDELSVGAPITNPNISCYVNSIIQALAHCPILCDAIRASLNNEKCRDANTPPLTRAVEQVIALIHQQPASATPINISRFYDEALPIVFKGQYDLDVQQQDANEFLFSLVEALEKEWNEHKNLSTKHILEPFQCSWSYIRQCTACNHTDTVSYKDHYNNVGLDILQDKYLLAELYENVFENKEYEGVCENCGKTTNKKQTQIYDHLPNIITVYIKRTVAGKAQNFKTIKTFKKLIYPETFEIGSGGGSDVSSERKTYNLSGVVLHLGKTIQQGHYITLVRDMSKKIGTTDRWWKLDDAQKQREMTESDVLNFHKQVAVLLYSSQALNDSVAKQDAGPMGLGEDKSATVASCHEDTDNNSEKDVAEQRQPVVVNEAPEEEEQQDAMDATAEMDAEEKAKEDRKTCTFDQEGPITDEEQRSQSKKEKITIKSDEEIVIESDEDTDDNYDEDKWNNVALPNGWYKYQSKRNGDYFYSYIDNDETVYKTWYHPSSESFSLEKCEKLHGPNSSLSRATAVIMESEKEKPQQAKEKEQQNAATVITGSVEPATETDATSEMDPEEKAKDDRKTSEKDDAEQRQQAVVNEAQEKKKQQDAMDATAEMVAEKNAKEDRKTCTFYLEGGCKNLAIRGGLCWKHGAKGKKCSMEGCIKFSQMNGICAKHGAKKKRPAPPMCSIKDCNNFAYRKGCCWTHNKDKGELFVCSVDQCKKFAQKDGKCGKHHGSVIKKRKICSYDGCKKFSQVGGRCKTHKQIL
jgi:ubiquitin C-terminal hydrolase